MEGFDRDVPPINGTTTVTLRRCLFLATVAAIVLSVGFIVLVARLAVVVAGGLAVAFVEGVLFLTMLGAIPYALGCLVYLASLSTLPEVLLFLMKHWPILKDCWNWLLGR